MVLMAWNCLRWCLGRVVMWVLVCRSNRATDRRVEEQVARHVTESLPERYGPADRLLREPRRRRRCSLLGEEGGVGVRTVLFDRRESFGEQLQRVVYLLVSAALALAPWCAERQRDRPEISRQ